MQIQMHQIGRHIHRIEVVGHCPGGVDVAGQGGVIAAEVEVIDALMHRGLCKDVCKGIFVVHQPVNAQVNVGIGTG